MDSSAYDFKVKELLTNDSVYKQLPDKSNPLNAVVQRVNKIREATALKMIKLVNWIILIFEVIKV